MKKLALLGVFLLVVLSIHTSYADTLPDGCTATTKYSSTTGHPCTLPDCAPGDLFSGLTGKPCSVFLPGCYSTQGFSVTTGHKCDGSSPAQTIINNPVPTGNTSTQTMQNNSSTPADNTQPADTAPNVPVQLTPKQIQDNALDALVVQIRAKYPHAYFVQGILSNGKGGTYMVESQDSTNKVAELIVNDDGSVNINWTDGSTS